VAGAAASIALQPGPARAAAESDDKKDGAKASDAAAEVDDKKGVVPTQGRQAFSGIYSDPGHPKGFRSVRVEKGRAIVVLQDEPGAEIFTVNATINTFDSGTNLLLDLSAKAGKDATNVPAVVGEGVLTFPDGNSWSKLSGVDGVYSDPSHPEGYRVVRSVDKSNVSVTLQDEPGAPVVEVSGSVNGNNIMLDLSAKGGPKDLVASIAGGKIVFPDGNAWPKL